MMGIFFTQIQKLIAIHDDRQNKNIFHMPHPIAAANYIWDIQVGGLPTLQDTVVSQSVCNQVHLRNNC